MSRITLTLNLEELALVDSKCGGPRHERLGIIGGRSTWIRNLIRSHFLLPPITQQMIAETSGHGGRGGGRGPCPDCGQHSLLGGTKRHLDYSCVNAECQSNTKRIMKRGEALIDGRTRAKNG